MSKQIGTYNLETGEIGNNITVYDLEDEQKRKLQTDRRKSDDKFKEYVDEKLGTFYFLFYKLIDKGISRQYVVRFLYLCTYMDYDNNLIYGNSKGDGRYMIDKDLKEVLKLGKTEMSYTKKELLKNNLIYLNDDNKVCVNSKYCLKGKIEGNKKKSVKVRIFENGIRELYEKSKPNEHKKLSLLIELLPYINLKNNVICENPDCEIKSEIKPLSMKQICNIVNYAEKHSSKLKKDLLSLSVNGEYVIKFNETFLSKYIEVNPKIYYKGTTEHLKELKILVESFEFKGGK